jgi:hypothetical protein
MSEAYVDYEKFIASFIESIRQRDSSVSSLGWGTTNFAISRNGEEKSVDREKRMGQWKTSLKSKQHTRIPVWFSTRKNRWASGVSLWNEHKTKKLLVGRGSCYEAETQIVRFGNHRSFRSVRMSIDCNCSCSRFRTHVSKPHLPEVSPQLLHRRWM